MHVVPPTQAPGSTRDDGSKSSRVLVSCGCGAMFACLGLAALVLASAWAWTLVR